MLTGRRWVNHLLSALPFLIVALCVWATIPYGGVARWAWATIVAGCFAVGAAAWLGSSFLPESRRPPLSEILLWGIGTIGLFGWAVWQMMPMPVATLQDLHAGAAELYGRLFAEGDSTPLSFDRDQSGLMIVSWIGYAVLLWTVARFFLRDSSRIERMCVLIALAGTFQAVMGMVSHSRDGLFANAFVSARFNGTFSGANSFGGYLAITIPVTLSLLVVKMTELLASFRGKIFMALNDKHTGRPMALLVIWMFLGITVQVVGVILSASRGASIALLVSTLGFLLWFTLNARKLKAGKALLGLAALLSVGVVIALSSGYLLLWERLQKLSEDDLSMQGRIEIWQASLKMFGDHPLGVGAGAYREAIPRYQLGGFGDKRFDLAHNDYLQLLCELGWPGVLPVAMLALLFFLRAGRVFRMSSAEPLTWLARGLFFSVVAGLMHAAVDFNLSSRPGVIVTFCVVAATLLGACGIRRPAAQRDRSSVEPSAYPRSARRKRRRRSRREGPMLGKFTLPDGIVLVLLVLIGIAGSHHMHVHGKVRDLVVRGWTGITSQILDQGLDDPYQWKGTPRTDDPVAVLNKAVEILPRDGTAQHVLGRTMAIRADQELNEAVDSASERVAASMGPDVPEELLESAVNITYQLKVAALAPSYHEAIEHLHNGVRLAPWRPDTHAWYGRLLCENTLRSAEVTAALEAGRPLPPESRERIDEGMRHLELAMELGPNDTASLITVVYGWVAAREALAGEATDEIQARIQNLGRRVVALGSRDRKEIILIWHSAGISLEEMMAIERLPLASLRDLYYLYNEAEDDESCARCLDLMELAISEPESDTGLVRRSEKDEEHYRDTLQQFVVSQRARWQMRRGEWEAYANSREERRGYWHDALARVIDADNRTKENLQVRLETLEETVGLPLRESLQLAKRRWQLGEQFPADRTLMRAALRDDISATVIADHKWWDGAELKSEDAGAGMMVMEARGRYLDDRPQDAREMLLPLFGERKSDVPVTLRHRLHWLNAQCLATVAFADQAKEQVRLGLERCREDPSLLQLGMDLGMGDQTISDRHGDPITISNQFARFVPRIPLNTGYFGEGIELTGFDLRESSGIGKKQLRTYWRFWSKVPIDLEVVVRAASARGTQRYRNSVRFRHIADLQFGGGDPKFGSVIVVETDLPSFIEPADRLTIALYSRTRRRYITSDDGLGALEWWNWADSVTPFQAE